MVALLFFAATFIFGNVLFSQKAALKTNKDTDSDNATEENSNMLLLLKGRTMNQVATVSCRKSESYRCCWLGGESCKFREVGAPTK